MPRAAIDIGSNSVLLTVVDDDGDVIHDEARVVGLGRGLGDRGQFQIDRMNDAESALADYVNTANDLGVASWMIQGAATSAARRALNAETWFAKLKRELGLKVDIISGQEEARLTWLGARWNLPGLTGSVAVVDLGGGSTEIVIGTPEPDGAASGPSDARNPDPRSPDAGSPDPGSPDANFRVSLELGSARLTEAWLGTDTVSPASLTRLSDAVDATLNHGSLPILPKTLIAVAGTATTLSAMNLGLKRWDPSAVHGSTLSRDDLGGLIDQLAVATPTQRRALVTISPKRADYMLAGAVVLNRLLARSPGREFLISVGGLRYGLLASP